MCAQVIQNAHTFFLKKKATITITINEGEKRAGFVKQGQMTRKIEYCQTHVTMVETFFLPFNRHSGENVAFFKPII